MEMISKLGPLARACFFLSLAAARLALRLAQLLCVRPRPAFSASPFASSASRSAQLEDISRDRRPEHEARERDNLARPGFGSSAGCFYPWLPGERGTPIAPGGLGRRRRQPPPSFRRTTTSRRRPPPRKRNGRACARTRRASGTSSARARGAHVARLPARNRRVSRRAERRVSRRAERRVSRRAD